MINFIKNLFKSKEIKKQFIPQDEIQELLISEGFTLSPLNDNVLVKKTITHQIIYDIKNLSINITKDGGTIILKSFGDPVHVILLLMFFFTVAIFYDAEKSQSSWLLKLRAEQ